MHKDFVGNELQIGDVVVFPEPGYRNLAKGRIIRFTPKKVVIERKWYGDKTTTYTIEPEGYVVRVENLLP